jgi:hypothetical protein
MKKVFFSVFLILAASSCGYDGSYRYSCQDPENWEDPNCHPPICLVDNMCTEILLGFNPTETTIEITQDTGDSNG